MLRSSRREYSSTDGAPHGGVRSAHSESSLMISHIGCITVATVCRDSGPAAVRSFHALIESASTLSAMPHAVNGSSAPYRSRAAALSYTSSQIRGSSIALRTLDSFSAASAKGTALLSNETLRDMNRGGSLPGKP